MSKVITAREADEMVRRGEKPPAGAVLTPSARDVFGGQWKPAFKGAVAAAKKTAAGTPDGEFRWTPGTDPKTPGEIDKFFNSPALRALKERICEMGRRLWQREYTGGTNGTITIRVGDRLALCTPALVSKGFMQPEDLCLVDLAGQALAGTRACGSEAKTHFALMKRQPSAKACIEAQPPHATAFALAEINVSSCLTPAAMGLLGGAALAKSTSSGMPADDEISQAGQTHQVVLIPDRGVIAWGKDVEEAQGKMENIDAHCRVAWIAAGLGRGPAPVTAVAPGALREKPDAADPRAGLKECQLCDSAEFRPGVVSPCPDAAENGAPRDEPPDPAVELVVQQITDQIIKNLPGK